MAENKKILPGDVCRMNDGDVVICDSVFSNRYIGGRARLVTRDREYMHADHTGRLDSFAYVEEVIGHVDAIPINRDEWPTLPKPSPYCKPEELGRYRLENGETFVLLDVFSDNPTDCVKVMFESGAIMSFPLGDWKGVEFLEPLVDIVRPHGEPKLHPLEWEFDGWNWDSRSRMHNDGDPFAYRIGINEDGLFCLDDSDGEVRPDCGPFETLLAAKTACQNYEDGAVQLATVVDAEDSNG